MREALLYDKLENNLVACRLCAHRCRIADNSFGVCKVRENVGGVLYTHSYGRPVAMQADCVEKKPLYHFLPGTKSFSIAAAGCNLRCLFCQNWEISQIEADGSLGLQDEELSCQEIVSEAFASGCKSISYTYTEPTVFFEYALDTAKLARNSGLQNAFVTNGYMTPDCLNLIAPYLDAANVDLKFFREDAYRRVCGASLQPVLDSIRLMKQLNIWVEITTLVIPKENDSRDELCSIAEFISSVSKEIPWHISRFHPDYKFTGYPVTPEDTLRMAQAIGNDAGLNFVYAGNVYGWGGDTLCPSCGKLLVKREGLKVMQYNLREGKCAFCGSIIPGVY